MPMSTGATKALPQTARGRHSTLPVAAYLTLKIAESGKTNSEIAEVLGYPRPNVIAMMKTGSMRLPINKVVSMARCIDVDPVFLLEKVITESSPEMWDGLKSVIGDRLISRKELKLVEFVRKQLDGVDADLTEYRDFTDAVKGAIKPVKEREKALTKGSLERIAREKVRRVA
jgi:hypothetical protein